MAEERITAPGPKTRQFADVIPTSTAQPPPQDAIAAAINAEDMKGFADEAERKRAERAEKLMLHGPQESSQAIKQTSVDAMFHPEGSQDAIDALFP